ncbi:MAG: F0F1 ATP synthase subunit A [Terriglobales bacterium]|jgi:F-type H+-transporting ATPase subunit a
MHTLLFTELLNRLFAGPVTALLQLLHVPPSNPMAPIPDHVAMQILIVLALTVVFVLVRMSLSVESPGVLQHTMEGISGFVGGLGKEIIGHDSERYLPYLITLGMFIFFSNMLGLIPGLASPTAKAVVPLGCAVVTWIYYNYHGLRTNGFLGYLKHFAGPVWWLAFLMFPIEVFSHLARLMSLTVRLYANIFAGEMVTLVFFSLLPVLFPILFMGLHVFFGTIQAYIFVLLAAVYLGEATAHEH